jgi:hypothetical protein
MPSVRREEKQGSETRSVNGFGFKQKESNTRDRSVVRGRRYQPWTAEVDEELARLVAAGATLDEMERVLERSRGDVATRIRKLGL